MRASRLLVALAVPALAACAAAPPLLANGPAPVAIQNGPSTGGLVVASPAPAAATLDGEARLGGKPFAGATVTAYLLGTRTEVAHAKVGVTGHYALPLDPASLQKPLKLVAHLDMRTLATVYLPAARKVQALSDAQIGEASTLALLSLGDRLEQMGHITLDAAARDALREALETLIAATSARLDADPSLADGVSLQLDPGGQGSLSQSQALSLSLDPSTSATLMAVAGKLGTITATAIATKAADGTITLIPAIQIGKLVIPAVALTVTTDDPAVQPFTPTINGLTGGVDGADLPVTDLPASLELTVLSPGIAEAFNLVVSLTNPDQPSLHAQRIVNVPAGQTSTRVSFESLDPDDGYVVNARAGSSSGALLGIASSVLKTGADDQVVRDALGRVETRDSLTLSDGENHATVQIAPFALSTKVSL